MPPNCFFFKMGLFGHLLADHGINQKISNSEYDDDDDDDVIDAVL